MGVHYTQVALHKPQQAPRIGRVMTVCPQLAYYLGLLGDPRLSLRDVPIRSSQILALI